MIRNSAPFRAAAEPDWDNAPEWDAVSEGVPTFSVPELAARLLSQRELMRPLQLQVDELLPALRDAEAAVEGERARCMLDHVTETNAERRKAQLRLLEDTDPGLRCALDAHARLLEALDRVMPRLEAATLDYRTTYRVLLSVAPTLHAHDAAR